MEQKDKKTINGTLQLPTMETEAVSTGHSYKQTAKWSLPFLAAFLPIVLISVFSYRIASDSVRDLLKTEHESATANLSQLLMEDLREGMNLVTAVASIPGTVEAVQNKDSFTMRSRLKAVTVSYPQVDRAYVVYPDGILWEEHPTTKTPRGLDLSHTEWYEHMSKNWKPYASGMYRRSVRDNAAIALAAPIKDAEGVVLGILVFEYPTTQIVQWLQNISLSHGGYLLLVDHRGNLVAHPSSQTGDPLYSRYGELQPVQQALGGQIHMEEYRDPLYQTQVVASFLPVTVGGNIWVIIAQQPTVLAYTELKNVSINIGLVGGIMTLLTLLMVVAVARIDSRNVLLNNSLTFLNQELREVASIVHYSNDAIIGLTLDGVITSWNSSAEAMYGYKAQEMIGKSIVHMVPDEKREELDRILEKLQKGKGTEDFETLRLHEDGTIIPVSITLSPVDDGDETIIAASSIDRDITERKEVDQMKNDFISFVSHQLKAPVTAMRWLLEEILDGDFGEVTPELQNVLRDMEGINAGNHNLISDILNVSRIDRGVIVMDTKSILLSSITEKAARNYHTAAKKKGLSLTVDNSEQEILVLADAEKMAEAISNAISNAIKHTETGGISITAFVEDGYGVVEVEDTGTGMPLEMLEKLFTRDQILGGNANPERSAGLGLYIAQKFMIMQNGDISARSIEGRGSTFAYRIPLSEDLNIEGNPHS
jgi:PAS domain S-box-containing protein